MMFDAEGDPDVTTNTNNTNAASSSTQVLSSMHQDYVHHVAFDIYGRRMATCSGDRFVRVWDLTDTGEWSLVGEWSAHRGSVSMLSWGHPEFGSLLATCGSDHEAKIWEERATHAAPAFTNSSSGTLTSNSPTSLSTSNNNHNNTTTASASRWTIKAQLTEARRAVSCCEFAPRHWGLKLATGSADGCVRIYEAVDVMNLAQWPLAATLQCFGEGLGVTCLSWSTGRFEPSTLVVGGPHIAIYRYIESARQWNCLFQLPPPSYGGDVLDVSWAPNVGRRYHYIASAEGQQLRIAKLSRGNGGGGLGTDGTKQDQLELESTQTLEVSNAWRCQWNVTGTVLASSGDRGVVQLWKSDLEGNFKCVSKIQGDLTQVATSSALALSGENDM
jgi:nucleoporin SEH1